MERVMYIIIDPSQEKPLYQQIIDEIIRLIEWGVLEKPGQETGSQPLDGEPCLRRASGFRLSLWQTRILQQSPRKTQRD
jgi:hypothetical protein